MLGSSNGTPEMLDMDREDPPLETNVRTPDALWANCVNILITLCESMLLDENLAPIKPSDLGLPGGDSEQRPKQRSESPSYMANIPHDPPPSKRKRNFADTARESKAQRLSDNLANQVARSLTFAEDIPSTLVASRINAASDDEDEPSFMDFESSSRHDTSPRTTLGGMPIGAVSSSTAATTRHFRNVASRGPNRYLARARHVNHTTTFGATMDLNHYHTPSITQPSLIPTLRRMSSSSPSSSSSPFQSSFGQQPVSLDAWITTQALKRSMDPPAFKLAFEQKTEELKSALVMLQDGTGKSYDEIKGLMETVIRAAEWMSGDYEGKFVDLFPQWALVESSLENVARYIQTVEDMKQLVIHPFPRTADSATDLRTAQSLLESKRELYGNALLTQNGLEWKVMAMPEQDHLIAAVKGWFYSLALALLGEVNMDVAKLRSQGMEEGYGSWREKEVGKLMDTVLSVLEFTSDCIDFTALPSSKLTASSTILATIYTQYTCSQLDRITPSSSSLAHSTRSLSTHSPRVDIRFMHHLENVCRLLTHLRIISESELASPFGYPHQYHRDDPSHDVARLGAVEDLSTALVDLGLRACVVVQGQRQRVTHSIRPSAAVTGPVGFVYVYEFLLRFVGRVVEFAGREGEEEGRMQRLLSSLEHLEATLPSM